MILPRNPLQRRETSSTNYVWIVSSIEFSKSFNGLQPQALLAAAAGLFVLVILISFIRRRRIKSATPPSYLPTNYLRQRWQEWRPRKTYAGVRETPSQRAAAASPTTRPSSEVPTSSVNESSRTEADLSNNRLSVRSIATLPPYHVAPLPSERLIAREGERAGVDTVVEYPESETDLEARREEEMETLYTIREARRREQREREDRRVERRNARERGDWLRLEQLESESRARARAREDSSNNPTPAPASADHSRQPSDTSSLTHINSSNSVAARSQQDSSLLIAELNSLRDHNSRTRRVSSVSYAALGVARHDGSRIRNDSIDSDHRPLLDSAAPIGRSRATSRASSTGGEAEGGRSHSRSRSRAAPFRDGSSSTHNLNNYNNSNNSPDLTRPSTGGSNLTRGSANEAEGEEQPTALRGRQLDDHDDGFLPAPPDPPSYEDDISVHGTEEAPPYSSPVLERNSLVGVQFPAPAHVAANPGSVERAVSPRGSVDVSREQGQRGEEEIVGASAPKGAQWKQKQQTGPLPPVSTGAPLRLLVTNESTTAPSIEVSSATPVSSLPPTPGLGGFER